MLAATRWATCTGYGGPQWRLLSDPHAPLAQSLARGYMCWALLEESKTLARARQDGVDSRGGDLVVVGAARTSSHHTALSVPCMICAYVVMDAVIQIVRIFV